MNIRSTVSKLGLSLVAALALISCDNNEEIVQTPEVSTGVLVLNQGKYNGNNATITSYDFTTQVVGADIFSAKNNRGLGDTGQDMIKYGSKIYIAVSSSSLIEIIDAKTYASIKTIPMRSTSDLPSKPRSLTSLNGKVYISLFDGHVAQLDTTDLTIKKTITVGSYPEQIIAANNKLYVANSGGMATVVDSTISVIDPTTFTESKRIKVGKNPTKIQADKYGDLYVICMGNYFDIPVSLKRVETSTDKVSEVTGFTPYNMTIDEDNLFLYAYEYDATWTVVNKKYIIFDVKNETIKNENFIASSAVAKTPYSIDVDPITKNIFIGESDYTTAGKMYCFGQDGILKYSFTTGINPGKTVFITNK